MGKSLLSYHDEELEMYVVFLEFKAGEIVALLPDQELGEERSGSSRRFWGCWPQKS